MPSRRHVTAFKLLPSTPPIITYVLFGICNVSCRHTTRTSAMGEVTAEKTIQRRAGVKELTPVANVVNSWLRSAVFLKATAVLPSAPETAPASSKSIVLPTHPTSRKNHIILFKVFEERSFWKPICYAVLSIQGSIAWVLTFSPFIDGRSRDVLRGIPRGCCEQPRPMSYRPVLRAKGV